MMYSRRFAGLALIGAITAMAVGVGLASASSSKDMKPPSITVETAPGDSVRVILSVFPSLKGGAPTNYTFDYTSALAPGQVLSHATTAPRDTLLAPRQTVIVQVAFAVTPYRNGLKGTPSTGSFTIPALIPIPPTIDSTRAKVDTSMTVAWTDAFGNPITKASLANMVWYEGDSIRAVVRFTLPDGRSVPPPNANYRMTWTDIGNNGYARRNVRGQYGDTAYYVALKCATCVRPGAERLQLRWRENQLDYGRPSGDGWRAAERSAAQ